MTSLLYPRHRLSSTRLFDICEWHATGLTLLTYLPSDLSSNHVTSIDSYAFTVTTRLIQLWGRGSIDESIPNSYRSLAYNSIISISASTFTGVYTILYLWVNAMPTMRLYRTQGSVLQLDHSHWRRGICEYDSDNHIVSNNLALIGCTNAEGRLTTTRLCFSRTISSQTITTWLICASRPQKSLR